MRKPVTAILGLGRSVGVTTARRLLAKGHDVVIGDADHSRLVKAVDTLDGAVAMHHGDLHTRLGLRNCLATALETYGRIDHVISIPPIPDASDLMSLEMERFDKALARSTRGAVLALRIFSEHFSGQELLPGTPIERGQQKGTLTFILKLSACQVSPGQFTEAVSQHAILGVMRAGAIELAEHGIRTNAVVAIRPRAEEDEPWVRLRTPLRRAATADEIAEAAIYLSSPEAAIITGETLLLDGGRSILGGVLD